MQDEPAFRTLNVDDPACVDKFRLPLADCGLMALRMKIREADIPGCIGTQAFDLELVKRKYAKFIDIITYEELVLRLDRLIASLQQRLSTGCTTET